MDENNCLHHGIREIPFKLVYGQNPLCGINGLPILSNDMALRLRTESNIAEFYGHQPEFNLESITFDGGLIVENRLGTHAEMMIGKKNLCLRETHRQTL